jgi:hypothetical protein
VLIALPHWKEGQQAGEVLRLSKVACSVKRSRALQATKIISNAGSLTISARPIDAGQEIFENINVQTGTESLSEYVLEMLPPNALDGKKIGHSGYPR